MQYRPEVLVAQDTSVSPREMRGSPLSEVDTS